MNLKEKNISIRKHFFGALIFSLIFIFWNPAYADAVDQNLSNYFQNNGTWKVFHSVIDQFQAAYPTYPAYKTETSNPPLGSETEIKSDTYSSCPEDKKCYEVAVTSFPDNMEMQNPEHSLEAALNGSLNSIPGNKLVSSNLETRKDGLPELTFLIQNGNVFIRGKYILREHKLYQIAVLYSERSFDENDYTKFMNSFSFE